MLPHKISSSSLLLLLLHGNIKENPKVVNMKENPKVVLKKKEKPVLLKENMHITFVFKNAQC